MVRSLSLLLVTFGVSAAAYGQVRAQLVLDHFNVLLRLQCVGTSDTVETTSPQPPGSKFSGTKTCNDSFAAGVSATTSAELSFTSIPAAIAGSFVSASGTQPDGTFTSDAPVVTQATFKVVMTVPAADGHGVLLGDLGNSCPNSADNQLSSAFQGVRTVTVNNTCTRKVSNITSGQVSFRTFAVGAPQRPHALMGNSALPPPQITADVSAVYRLELLPSEDLVITHIHAVQAIQTPAGNVTLIAGKNTALRVFIRSLGASAKSVAGVRALLRCKGPDGTGYFAGSSNAPMTALPIAALPAPDSVPDLANASADIQIPEKCTAAGSRSIEAEITLPGGAADPVPANNLLNRTFTFAAPPGSKPFKIAWYKVGYQPPGQDTVSRASDRVNSADSFFRRVYPLPEKDVDYFPVTMAYPVWTRPLVTSADGKALRDDIAAVIASATSADGDVFDQVVVWVPNIPEFSLLGVADSKYGGGDGRVVLVHDVSPEIDRTVMAHEIAHNLGIRHTNSPDSACPNFAPDDETAWPYANPRTQTYGYFQATMQPLGPDLFDFMSYCPHISRWISPYTSEALYLNNLQPTGGKPGIVVVGAAAQDVWLISGTARRDGSTGKLDSVLKVNTASTTSQSQANGNHCIRFSGASGALSSFCFDLTFRNDEGGTQDEQSFLFRVPIVANATRAALTVGVKELAVLTTGAAIQPSITAPQAGQTWQGGTRTISWTSTGSPQRYAVQYSSDGGSSWLSLAATLTANQLVMDTSQLQGGSNLRFRVLASAGLTTGLAEVGPINLVQNPRLEVPAGTFELHSSVINQGIEREILLSNTGDGPLRITGFTPSGGQFQVIRPRAPTTILAGDRVPLVLLFTPSAVGDITGSLRIDSDGGTANLTLHGKGINSPTAEIAASPAALAFGTTAQGQGKTMTLTVRNFGPAPLNVTQVSITGTGFGLAAVAPAPFTLNVAETRDILVRYVPTAAGAASGTITIASNDPAQPSLVINLTGTATAVANIVRPVILAGGVVNAASFAPGLSRGALGSVFGTGMTNGTELVTAAIWPRLAQGTRVLVAGIEAPLYYLSPGLINFQVPYEVPLGQVQVVVVRDSVESLPQNVLISDFALGVFGYPRTANDYDPIVVHLDGSLVTPTNRAKAGEFLLAFVTGLGVIDGSPVSGVGIGVNPLPYALAATTVTLGGAPVQSLYNGMTPGFIGLGQMNIKLPDTLPAGAFLPLRITVGNSVITVNLHVQ